MGKKQELELFGDSIPWNASDWTSSDDRVRGGKSQSYLSTSDSGARFYGHLDIKTLGGAGFASQRTTTISETWDLSSYDGIRLDLGKSDGKRYTFVLKDELSPRNPENGREQATVSYEYDFKTDDVMGESSFVVVPWKDFTPTYRGKEVKGAKKLDRGSVMRFSVMMRSFFGDQEGDFSLTIKSIKAVPLPKDVEKGLVAEKSDSSDVVGDYTKRLWYRRSTLVSLLAFSLLTYGVCTLICPSLKYGHVMRHWHW